MGTTIQDTFRASCPCPNQDAAPNSRGTFHAAHLHQPHTNLQKWRLFCYKQEPTQAERIFFVQVYCQSRDCVPQIISHFSGVVHAPPKRNPPTPHPLARKSKDSGSYNLISWHRRSALLLRSGVRGSVHRPSYLGVPTLWGYIPRSCCGP